MRHFEILLAGSIIFCMLFFIVANGAVFFPVSHIPETRDPIMVHSINLTFWLGIYIVFSSIIIGHGTLMKNNKEI